jgi:hypothetical protein
MLIKSAQFSLGITLVNVILSLILSQVFFEGFATGQFIGTLGNITLLESMLLVIYGSIVFWTNTKKLRAEKTYEPYPVYIRAGRWVRWVLPTMRRIVGVDEGDPRKERRGFFFLLCGAFLLAEIIALALVTR